MDDIWRTNASRAFRLRSSHALSAAYTLHFSQHFCPRVAAVSRRLLRFGRITLWLTPRTAPYRFRGTRCCRATVMPGYTPLLILPSAYAPTAARFCACVHSCCDFPMRLRTTLSSISDLWFALARASRNQHRAVRFGSAYAAHTRFVYLTIIYARSFVHTDAVAVLTHGSRNASALHRLPAHLCRGSPASTHHHTTTCRLAVSLLRCLPI